MELARRYTSGRELVAFLILAAAILVMLSWHFRWTLLLQIYPAWAPMQFNTALGFFLLGLCILFKQQPKYLASCALLLLLLAGSTFWQYLFGYNLGIDELLMVDFLQTRTVHKGRMGPNTAFCFILLALSCLPIRHPLFRWLASPAAAVALGLAGISLAGYATGMTYAYGWRDLTSMAVHTATLFTVASATTLYDQFHRWKRKPDLFIQWQSVVALPIVIFAFLALQLPHIRGQELLQLDMARADANLLANQISEQLKHAHTALPLTDAELAVIAAQALLFSEHQAYLFTLKLNGKAIAGNYEGYWPGIAQASIARPDGELQITFYTTERHNSLFKRNFYFSLLISILIAALCVWLLRINHRRIQIQSALRTSLTRFQAMFAASQHGLALLDSEFNIIKKNAALDNIVRNNHATTLKQLIDNSEDWEKILSLVKEPQFTLAVRLNGNSAEISMSQLGEVGEHLVICKDLSMLEQATLANEKDNLLRQTLNATGSCLCLCDARGEIYISNRQFSQWAGHSVSGEKKLIFDYINEAQRNEFIKLFELSLSTANKTFSLECQLENNDYWEWCNCGITANVADNPQQRLITINFQSIKIRRELFEQLETTVKQLKVANADVEQFAYIASHDLKSPLIGIKNLSDWLHEDYHEKLDEEGKKHLDMIRSRCDRMTMLLDDLLIYSRAGTRPLEPASFNVNALIRDLCSLHDCSEFTTILGEDTDIISDRRALEVALRNVIANAIKHNPREDKQIAIQIESNAQTISISTEDNGPGVEPKYFDVIFKPFKTLQPRDQVEGSGMGLAITAKAINRLKGSIDVATSTLGGLNITLTIPKTLELADEQ